jgi:1-deoxy-D-xylulose-5-phosphate reductoisomerase
MDNKVKGLVILGSTGSVGTQTLDIVRKFPHHFRVIGLAARRSHQLLEEQIKEFSPRLVSCEGTIAQKAPLFINGCVESSMIDMVRDPEVNIVVTATTGDVALAPTIAAIEAGKDIALANKETIVMAGQLVTSLVEKHGVRLLPLDSEPNALWQCLQGEDKTISRLIITASGGSFRKTPVSELTTVTPDQALQHPNWKMGSKITIDSATMMNKAFEVIEAHWLFKVPWDRIEAVIHPQSIIHSMVEFVDGSVKAQISIPDMRLPIQYALFYPDRVYNEDIQKFDAVAIGSLSFESWDSERYPCYDLALEVARRDGTWPAVLCGADDAAVNAFLEGAIGFTDIHKVIKLALDEHHPNLEPTLTDIIYAGDWARNKVNRIVEEF